ncbi:hypothetical protein RC30_08710 [Campylobacter jejuni]|nr:hypothetical protein RC30_08710 [Campylobacter jejuni]
MQRVFTHGRHCSPAVRHRRPAPSVPRLKRLQRLQKLQRGAPRKRAGQGELVDELQVPAHRNARGQARDRQPREVAQQAAEVGSRRLAFRVRVGGDDDLGDLGGFVVLDVGLDVGLDGSRFGIARFSLAAGGHPPAAARAQRDPQAARPGGQGRHPLHRGSRQPALRRGSRHPRSIRLGLRHIRHYLRLEEGQGAGLAGFFVLVLHAEQVRGAPDMLRLDGGDDDVALDGRAQEVRLVGGAHDCRTGARGDEAGHGAGGLPQAGVHAAVGHAPGLQVILGDLECQLHLVRADGAVLHAEGAVEGGVLGQ